MSARLDATSDAYPGAPTALSRRPRRTQLAARERGGLMYVLYTSGSTGKPKGVMITQAGVTSQILWFRDELRAGPHRCAAASG